MKSEKFVKGVCCPHCFDASTDKQKDRYLERQKQIELAKIVKPKTKTSSKKTGKSKVDTSSPKVETAAVLASEELVIEDTAVVEPTE